MRQKLGQHFLKEKKTLSFIASHTNAETGDTIIEIGPGHGELTEFLLEEANKNKNRLFCIEKDETFFDSIEKLLKTKSIKNKLFRGDVREILPKIFNEEKIENYVLVGNIPYYLTSFLFRIISELPQKPRATTFLIQKEVATRIAQKEPDQNLLSAIISSFANAKVIKNVPRGQFVPPPNVDSAVIQLVTHGRYNQKECETYIKTAKILFAHPRKTIFNNLREKIDEPQKIKSLLREALLSESVRPQMLSQKNIITIAKMLYNEK